MHTVSKKASGRETNMKRMVFFMVFLVALIVVSSIWPAKVCAQRPGPSDDIIKENFKTTLQAADTNKDGKLSMQECMAIWKDKKKGEENCSYWDANSDGIITEDEYVKQARKKMK
jgi:hypothetical protein